MKTELKKSCSKCKYADWDADGCTCMIEKRLIGNAFVYVCDNFRPEKPFTNGDCIRQMTDEELARFLDITCGCSVCFLDTTANECTGFRSSMDCIVNKIKWLQQEATE